MFSQRYKTLAEQVAHEIRMRVEQGYWVDMMPGRQKLAAELGVNHKTCGAALKILETEGLLMPQGNGLGRVIVEQAVKTPSSSSIRFRLLVYERSDLRSHYLVEMLHRLRQLGHDADFSGRTMKGLGMNKNRIIAHIGETKADAWIVLASPRDVLEWLAKQPFPSFALFGRAGDVQIASIIPDKLQAVDELVKRLAGLGHQRIVLITREDRRKPGPGASERKFMESLVQQGLSASSYNLPDWGDSPEEMTGMLESLFRFTPPTAIILSEATLFFAAMQWLGGIGLSAPQDVSLACMDPSPIFEWSRPEITHINWETRPLINRMVRWANSISLGKDDRRKTFIHAKLIHGGTVGPAPKKPLTGRTRS